VVWFLAVLVALFFMAWMAYRLGYSNGAVEACRQVGGVFGSDRLCHANCLMQGIKPF